MQNTMLTPVHWRSSNTYEPVPFAPPVHLLCMVMQIGFVVSSRTASNSVHCSVHPLAGLLSAHTDSQDSVSISPLVSPQLLDSWRQKTVMVLCYTCNRSLGHYMWSLPLDSSFFHLTCPPIGPPYTATLWHHGTMLSIWTLPLHQYQSWHGPALKPDSSSCKLTAISNTGRVWQHCCTQQPD